MPVIQYGTTTIEYDIEYIQTKTINIIVEWMKGVQVLAPEGITDEQLLPILKRKAPWIAKKPAMP